MDPLKQTNETEWHMASEAAFFFDGAKLLEMAHQYSPDYRKADPFPHIVIENFMPEAVLDGVLEEFPDIDAIQWLRFKNAREKKLANNLDEQMPPRVRHLLAQFNSAAMCTFLEKLTGIEGIIPDPYFWGGGQHQIQTGGYLKIHADFNRHRKLRLDRRINLLLYLNRDWEESFGGHLELWDTEMTRCVQRILPIFNRCVIFNTTSNSYHGHPEPLTCPEDRTRKSLALYYYTQGRPEEEQQETHSTLFQQRPGENLETEGKKPGAKDLLRRCVPPILVDCVKAMRGRSDKH